MQGMIILRRVMIERFEHDYIQVSMENYKILFIVSMIIAQKQSGDEKIKNKKWSELFCISVSEINEAEITILKICEFRTFVSCSECVWIVNHFSSMFKKFLQSSFSSK
jgi:hypothetical protein